MVATFVVRRIHSAVPAGIPDVAFSPKMHSGIGSSHRNVASRH